MKFYLNIFAVVLVAFIPALSASAATLSLDPSSGTFGPGDTFVVTVRLDLSPDECMNAATVEVGYPANLIKASAVSKGESLLTLWPAEPTVDYEHGLVTFSGGTPGGYCGRVQGDPGKTNILGKIVFNIPGNMIDGEQITASTPFALSFGSNSMVLANDGLGTPLPLTLRKGEYVRTRESTGIKNEWLDIVHQDTTPPDIFTATIVQDPKTFQGKYFLVFSTVDKQSGVQHYEVQEDDPVHFGLVRGGKGERAIFVKATSPYVLRDQELGSRIIIRAYDHAGNVQEAILPPKGDLGTMHMVRPGGSVNSLWWYVLTGLALLLGSIVAFLIVRNHPVHKKEQ